MNLLKKVTYMGVGGLLVLLVVFGVAATLAQEDEGATASAPEAPATEAMALAAHPGPGRSGRGEFLAEALGITVEELADAGEAVRLARIDAALEQGLITEAQAEWLRESERRLPARLPFASGEFEFDAEAAMADALGITVEALDAARTEALELALAARVEAGQITEEEAALIAARRAVREHFDRDALVEMMQQMYEDAVQQAAEAGDITAEQAELLLDNPPAFNRFDPGPRGGQIAPGRSGLHSFQDAPAGFDA